MSVRQICLSAIQSKIEKRLSRKDGLVVLKVEDSLVVYVGTRQAVIYIDDDAAVEVQCCKCPPSSANPVRDVMLRADLTDTKAMDEAAAFVIAYLRQT